MPCFMKKIVNPFTHYPAEDYNCIGCSPNNKTGLNLQFYDTGKELMAHWLPENKYMGYKNVLHGGMQALLMDEIAGWVVYTKCFTGGVTSEMKVTYLKPLYISSGEIKVTGQLINFHENSALIKCSIYNSDGIICSSAEITYFCYPEPIAIKKYHYPGIEAFYEQKIK